jgi:hypothetical protein
MSKIIDDNDIIDEDNDNIDDDIHIPNSLHVLTPNISSICSRVRKAVSWRLPILYNTMRNAHAPKKKKVPLRPPTEDPGRIILGTDLLTAKLANQSAEVEIDTPLPRTDRGKISAGYNQAIGPIESDDDDVYLIKVTTGGLQNLSPY